MNTTINRQQWQEEEALRRFQLISPLLQTGLDDAKRIQLRKKIAEENNISVRSLYRYEKAFSERQFTGLKPADREKHRSQKLPENFSFLLEQAIQLRKEAPERSVAQIIYILETLSDIIQVGYFKATHGKRFFKMAPLHHHLERCGWSEVKIVTVFVSITAVFCLLAYCGIRGRYL